MGRPATDKKDRLLDAAVDRFHHHGVAASSLAAIAGDAGIPVGNVVYYFRTKDSLAAAVIDRWCSRVAMHLESFATGATPIDRIRAFVASARDRRQAYADFGCPLAALQSGLKTAAPPLADNAIVPLAMIRCWLSEQFAHGGLDQVAAREEADFYLAALQGSYFLAHATSDPDMVSATVDRLLARLDA